jgi:hypothetical protein
MKETARKAFVATLIVVTVVARARARLERRGVIALL